MAYSKYTFTVYYSKKSHTACLNLKVNFDNGGEMSESTKESDEKFKDVFNETVYEHTKTALSRTVRCKFNYLNLLGDLLVCNNIFDYFKNLFTATSEEFNHAVFEPQLFKAKQDINLYFSSNDFSQDYFNNFVNSKGISFNLLMLEEINGRYYPLRIDSETDDVIYSYESDNIENIIFSSVHFALTNGYKFVECAHCGRWFFKEGNRTGSRKEYCDRNSTFKGYEHLNCEQAVRNIKQQCGRIKKRIEAKANNANKDIILNHSYSHFVWNLQKQCEQFTNKSQKSNTVENLSAYMCFLISVEKRKEWQHYGSDK